VEGRSATLASIADEARALQDRLARLQPFVLQVPMVVAAGPSYDAQVAIENALHQGRHALGHRISAFLRWLKTPDGDAASPADAQKRLVFLRLGFNVVLTHLDLFSEAMTQRSESDVGVWLSGLDEIARDALRLPGFYDPPPVLCYLARGPGAAIRRARTRLPGGGQNPVAIIRLPRERMIGSGVASSLVHEVGHQAAALLDLVASLRAAVMARAQDLPDGTVRRAAWVRWSRWISEIVADFWAIARVGVTSTTGLISVVSLPRAFVLRDNGDDPHPTPWLRVKLSCAIGDALYPDEQWKRLAARWEALYPLSQLPAHRRAWVAALEAEIREFVVLLASHQPAGLRGRTLAEAVATEERSPRRLRGAWASWASDLHALRRAPPCLAFAVVGQARADGAITPEHEGALLADLLRDQAMRSTLNRAAICAVPSRRVATSATAPVVHDSTRAEVVHAGAR
jgi:hypothetical protein